MSAVQQLVVAIFQDKTQADLAMDELVRAGFEQHQIHFAGPGPAVETGGGVLEQIKSLFTSQAASTDWLYHDLIHMGVPPEETRYYQSEYEAGHSLVAVEGHTYMQMASLILARNGGYGANRSAANNSTQTQEPTQKETEMQEPAQKDAETQEPAQKDAEMREPNQEDVNTEPRRSTM